MLEKAENRRRYSNIKLNTLEQESDHSSGGHEFKDLTCFAYRDDSKKVEVRISNIEAAKALSDAVRTSLGPRGMDKMVRFPDWVDEIF